MSQQPSGGLPPRVYVPIVLVAAVVFLGTLGYLLRIGLGVTGAALGPSAGAPAVQGDARAQAGSVPPVPSRAPGEAAVPQSGGLPSTARGVLPPGNPVGGGGPAAGPPAEVVQTLDRLRARLAKNPADRDALLQLASLYAQAGKFSQSATLYARAVVLAPNDADARTSYAEVLQVQGKRDDALRQLGVALRSRADFPRALFDEGAIAADAGRRTQSIAAFRRFLSVAPNDPRAEDARSALRNLGAS